MSDNGSHSVAIDDHPELHEPASGEPNGLHVDESAERPDDPAVEMRADPALAIAAAQAPADQGADLPSGDATRATREPAPATAGMDDGAAEGDAVDEADVSVFVARLVQAMKATVASERSRLDEATERRRQARVDEIRSREAAEADRMRELADDDMRGIDSWAENVVAQIQIQREQRAAALRADLATSLEQHHANIESEIHAIETAIAGYRSELDLYFAALDTQTDPVAVASHAAAWPAFPALDTAPVTTPAAQPTDAAAQATDAAVQPTADVPAPADDSAVPTGASSTPELGQTAPAASPSAQVPAVPAPLAPEPVGVMDTASVGVTPIAPWLVPAGAPSTASERESVDEASAPVAATAEQEPAAAEADEPPAGAYEAPAAATSDPTSDRERTIAGYPVRPSGGVLQTVSVLRPVTSWLHRDSGNDAERERDR